MKNKLVISSALFCLSGNLNADDRFDVPRGYAIEGLAGNCAVGPFPQTSKAGRYNVVCDTLTDAEKCLGFIKQHFISPVDGRTIKTHDNERLNFCLDTLKGELGLSIEE